jgi:hypothetical protein
MEKFRGGYKKVGVGGRQTLPPPERGTSAFWVKQTSGSCLGPFPELLRPLPVGRTFLLRSREVRDNGDPGLSASTRGVLLSIFSAQPDDYTSCFCVFTRHAVRSLGCGTCSNPATRRLLVYVYFPGNASPVCHFRITRPALAGWNNLPQAGSSIGTLLSTDRGLVCLYYTKCFLSRQLVVSKFISAKTPPPNLIINIQ